MISEYESNMRRCWCKSKTYPCECTAPLFALHIQATSVSVIIATVRQTLSMQMPTTHSCRTPHEMRWWEKTISRFNYNAPISHCSSVVTIASRARYSLTNSKHWISWKYSIATTLRPFEARKLSFSHSLALPPPVWLSAFLLQVSRSGHQPLAPCRRSTCVCAWARYN